MYLGGFAGKTALVTGGASGIGRGVALAFAQAGAQVVVADIDVEGGESIVRQIRQAGSRALFVRTDVAWNEDVEALIKASVDTFGRLDCAFNNAGIELQHQRLAESE